MEHSNADLLAIKNTLANSNADLLAIKNTLANYCFALDEHDWNLLDKVFTKDAHCDYTEIGKERDYKDLLSFKIALLNILKESNTQHALTTQRIEFNKPVAEDGSHTRARAKTYFTANTFQGEDHTSVLGFYEDEVKKVSGKWLISKRKLHLHVSVNATKILIHVFGILI